jgi:hypothetical protein
MANTLRAMLLRIGLDHGANDNIVDVQGIDTIKELGFLGDEDISNLCKVVRRPGGHVPNPDFIENQVPPLQRTIPYLGIMIAQKSEQNMRLASYTVRHHHRISRTTNVGAMNPTSVRRLRELKAKEDGRLPDPPATPKIDQKNWPKTMDAIQDYFMSVLGESKAPLAYVIRDIAEVQDEHADAPTNYTTPEDEMVARMPHQDANGAFLPTYIHDRSKVWQTIAEICIDHSCWTYVKPYQRARDGRRAYLALHTHYLGSNHVNNMANAAESKLSTAKYIGETKRYNFEDYISLLNEQFQILNNLRRYGYSGIDEASKVRRLNAGIATNILDAPKAQIMSSRALQDNFDDSVDLYQIFIAQSINKGNASEYNVSGFEGGGGDRGGRGGRGHRQRSGGRSGRYGGRGGRGAGGGRNNRGRGGHKRRHNGGGGGVQDRHYSPTEYQALTDDQRTQLKSMRNTRHDQQNNNSDTREAAQLLTKILAGVSAAQTDTGGDDNAPDEGNPNRNHNALKKPKRG